MTRSTRLLVAGACAVALGVGAIGVAGAATAPPYARPSVPQPPPASTLKAPAPSGAKGTFVGRRVSFVCPKGTIPESRLAPASRAFTDYMGCSTEPAPGRDDTAASIVMFGTVPATALLPREGRDVSALAIAEDLARRLGRGTTGVAGQRTSTTTLAGQEAVLAELDILVDDGGPRTDHVSYWLFTVDGIDHALFVRDVDGVPDASRKAALAAAAAVKVS